MNNFQEKVSFIWSVFEILRGPYKRHEYGGVILPFTVLRRLDQVLIPTKEKVLKKCGSLSAKLDDQMKELTLCKEANQTFYNTSKFTLEALKADPENIAANLKNFINGFSSNARDIFITKFEFFNQIDKLDEANRLYQVVGRFCDIDLHPDKVSNLEMGYIFEELIRKASEESNESAGDHFTPREVIRLMVNLLFINDADALTKKGIIRTLYDPACGTGGMLSVAEDYIRDLNPEAKLIVFGQDWNPESYAICKSDMLIKGHDPQNIKFGSSFTKDGLPNEKFDYFLSNPPFGVDWKSEEKEIRKESEELGNSGRFGVGLPRVSDGCLLFLQHMISKFKDTEQGSRAAIVFSGSPLFSGSAGSGESEIRKWIIENDWLEAIVALPDQLFYNTGIFTYIWIVTNRKAKERKGKVQLLNAVSFFEKMRKSLGNKRNFIADAQISEITRLYGDFEDSKFVKIFDNEDFGYNRITVERPLKLNFSVSDERIEALKASSVFTVLVKEKKRGKKNGATYDGFALQETIIGTLVKLKSERLWKNREEFTAFLKEQFVKSKKEIEPKLLSGIVLALSERDETAAPCLDSKSRTESDAELRDNENVPLKEDIEEYFKREVIPHVPDAWIDESKTKVGYEINFNRYFYEYVPPRPLEEIQADIRALEKEILKMLQEVVA